jgi:hypothetical protein
MTIAHEGCGKASQNGEDDKLIQPKLMRNFLSASKRT